MDKSLLLELPTIAIVHSEEQGGFINATILLLLGSSKEIISMVNN